MKIEHQPRDHKGSFVHKVENETLAEMTYSKAGNAMIIIDHTEVSEKLRGLGVGNKLLESLVQYARANSFKVMPLCPFAKSVFEKREDLRDVL